MKTVVKPGTNTHRNQTGLCVDGLVLPRNVLPPVRIETMTASDYLSSVVRDRQPAIRSDFDVYLIENSLIYVKEQCSQENVEATFFLHLDPVDESDLPDHRKQYGFDNLDFNFDSHGVQFGGTCLATVPLPGYSITEIRTGQYVRMDGDFNNIWEGSFEVVGQAGDRKAAQ